jgi:N-methylhydantoinase A
MANAIRLVGVESGIDPRDFALIAFGGAGPLHARSVASRLGIRTLLIPPAPGLCSAFGALIAPPRVDRVTTYYASSESLDEAALFNAVERVAGEAVETLRLSVDAPEPTVERFASLRYLGQNFELEVPIVVDDRWEALRDRFAAEHERQYGFELPGEPIEIINLRATARRAETPPPTGTAIDDGGEAAGSREIWLDGPVDCPVVRRSTLAPGTSLTGPAVIEEPDSTTIVHPGDRVEADPSGSLLITIGGAA